MAILPYRQREDLPEEYRDLLDKGNNIHRISSHSPPLARLSANIGHYYRQTSKLDAKLREMALLQITYLANSPYEYSHHIPLALAAGAADADIHAIALETAGKPSHLDPLTKTVLLAARQMTNGIEASKPVMEELRDHFAPDILVELIWVMAFYIGLARFTGSFGVEVEPHFMGYLERFPLKAHVTA